MKKIELPKVNLKKPDLKNHKKVWGTLAALFAIAVVALISLVVIQLAQPGLSEDDKLNQKIDSLNQPGIRCEDTIGEIGQESPDKYDPSTQKKLLNQQFNCQAELGNDKNAIEAGEKLKTIYAKEGDEYMVKVTNLAIESIKSDESNKLRENDEQYKTHEPI